MRHLGGAFFVALCLIPGEARPEGCPQDCEAEEMDDFGCCPEPPPPLVVEPPPVALPSPVVSAPPPNIGKYGYGMVEIQPGTLQMGSLPSEKNRSDDETRHSVKLTQGFWMGETEVTQGLYEQVMGTHPSAVSSCGSACPVENVSWYDAVAFANQLSELEGLEKCYTISGESVSWPRGLACKGYRLPTEAEWEYAARAGGSALYAGSNEVGEVAWYDGNSGGTTHPVGQKSPNAWGLYDMSGNVHEWCWDWSGAYSGSSTDPVGPSSGSRRVNRGGSWWFDPARARVANRNWVVPSYRGSYLGFRLARSL